MLTRRGSKNAVALYHSQKGRVYRRTRSEAQTGLVKCPKCKLNTLELQSFVRGVKIYICSNCGWKITTDKVV